MEYKKSNKKLTKSREIISREVHKTKPPRMKSVVHHKNTHEFGKDKSSEKK